MNGAEVTQTTEVTPGSGSGSRRGALAALFTGSALGISSLAGVLSQDAEAKGKKAKKKDRRRNGNGGKGKGQGKGNGKGKGKGGKGGVGNTLPSVRFVETTTTFSSNGVGEASSKCPEGYLPISGGFFDSVPDPVLLTSMPRLEENDWYVELDDANDGEQITVIAICLAATDDTKDEDTEPESKSRRNRKRSRKN